MNLIITYPNSDLRHEKIINFLRNNFKNKENYFLNKNCGFEMYMNIAKKCEFIIGNSSSGIVESATLKVPSINIGSRQFGKIMPTNVINCKYNEKDILRSIKKINEKSFKKKLKKLKNPYESNFKTTNILKEILKALKNKNLLKKFKDY